MVTLFFFQNLRARIGEAGYHTMVYTGTFGVTQLRDENNRLVDIYLHRTATGQLQVPVPLYFYKVNYIIYFFNEIVLILRIQDIL